jgi:hypothetical protein
MGKPADPAVPFVEVYQSFLDDLATEGTKPSTNHHCRYNIVRFEKWLVETGHPATLAPLKWTILIPSQPAPRDPAAAAARFDPASPRRRGELGDRSDYGSRRWTPVPSGPRSARRRQEAGSPGGRDCGPKAPDYMARRRAPQADPLIRLAPGRGGRHSPRQHLARG